ncbi:Tubulin-tyrosine ligase family protein [Tritrichomonas foetus]|uniref:Tubulin--tyrosine ligase-like protein 5 n=1 Tax=Tritrichomonas foetus TaxID=1144522 RepID=A0A1J4J9D4_9EUKA|nr:Tubulin-tyrosine ligase family protein [Tritrichomonas foetus]|eukprot:OHS94291.1 Tubulin-tyrosine ligase family protein [Tritrichomonas foetus]
MSLDDLFSPAPLPYKYVNIPKPDDPPVERPKKLKFYVNQVITPLSKNAFLHSGFEQTESEFQWNTSWGRQFVINRYRGCKSWQKINHFAGAFLLGRKDYFHQRMQELKDRIGDKANFYPESYLLPKENNAFEKVYKNKRLWIVKPSNSSRGRGIYLVDSEKTELPNDEGIVQSYVERPLLITGRKFDVRLYALVTSIFPIRIYLHDSGLIRFATHKYDPRADPDDVKTHLTNYALNKDDTDFVCCQEDGTETISDSKWSIPFFIEYCKSNGIDHEKLFKEFERVTVSTILAGMLTIQSHHARNVTHRHTSYEQYGIDILVDENFHAYVLEINISPGMSGEGSKIDLDIKNRLMHDVLNMARIIDCECDVKNPCPGVDEIDRLCNLSLTSERNRSVRTKKKSAWDSPAFVDYTMIRDFVEEKSRLGGYRRVFPKRKTVDEYLPCLGELKYHDIAFIEWVKMDKAKRKQVLEKNLHEYIEKVNEINKSLNPNPGNDDDEM